MRRRWLRREFRWGRPSRNLRVSGYGGLCGERGALQAHRGAVAFFKGGELFGDAVFGDDEVGGLEAGDVVAFVVGDGDVELHEIDGNAEAGAVLLRVKVGGRGGERDDGGCDC